MSDASINPHACLIDKTQINASYKSNCLDCVLIIYLFDKTFFGVKHLLDVKTNKRAIVAIRL